MKLNKLRLDFMDFVLDLPQVSCGEGFQLTFDQMLGTDFFRSDVTDDSG